jgi:hypothetical protein
VRPPPFLLAPWIAAVMISIGDSRLLGFTTASRKAALLSVNRYTAFRARDIDT